jgi:hypothetical protein
MGVAAAALWASRGFSELGRVFPVAIAATILVAGAALVLRILTGREAPSEAAGGSPVRRLLLVLVAAAWVLLLEPLGFMAASLLGFLAASGVATFEPLGVLGWLKRMGIAAAVVLGLALLFERALLVPLPQGWLWR